MAGKADGQRSGRTKPEHPVQDTLAHPMETMTAVVDRVPGVDAVKGIADGVLDSVGIVSPHARRITAYAGAGLLGAAGLIEWPVAVAGAAAVWLTQPRPKDVVEQPEDESEGLRAKKAARSAKASTTSATSTASRKPKSSTTATAKKSTAKKATAKKSPAKKSTTGRAKTSPSTQRSSTRKTTAAGRKKT